jgi:hypothetical protein
MSASALRGLYGHWIMAFLFALVVFQCVQFVPSVFAQSELATVSGRITDPSGAVLPDVEVEIRNVETNVSEVRKTNSDGLYLIASLHPGHYVISVRRPGFKTVSVTDVTLNVQDNLVRNVQLQVGSISESITVTAEGEKINTTDASVSTVIDRETVANIPLNGRSFQSLLELTPGTNAFNPSSSSGSLSDQGQFTVNGQRTSSNYFTVDGVSANTGASESGSGTLGQAGTGSLPGTTALGGFNSLVSVDALQEFRITTSTFAPEYGRTPGGQVALSTRAGTNSFHGDVFDYFRNTVLDANDWFLNSQGKPRGTERQNDFGGVLGGAVVKDKLFFFGSYEGLRLDNPSPSTALVPTLDARVLARNAQNNGGAVGYMYPFLNAYPLPNRDPSIGDGSTCTPPLPGSSLDPCLAAVTKSFASYSNLDSASIRSDYVPNGTTSVFGRYVHAPSSSVSVGSLLSVTTSKRNLGSDSGTIGFTALFGGKVTNDLRFNYSHATALDSDTASSAFTGSFGTIFPAGFAQPPASYSAKQMAVQLQTLGVGFGVQGFNLDPAGVNSKQTQYNIVDSALLVKGTHIMKFGMDLRVTDPNVSLAPFSIQATFSKSSGFLSTGGGGGGPQGPPTLGCGLNAPGMPVAMEVPSGTPTLPNYICGLASSVNITNNYQQNYRFQNWSVFAQDTWKVTSQLTLTYGIRYDVDPAPYSLNGRPFFSLNNFDPTKCNPQATLGGGGVGSGPPDLTPFCNVGINRLGTAPYPTSWTNIAPRIGIAYQLSHSANWSRVLRGGFGIFYDTAADASASALGPFSPTFAYPLSQLPSDPIGFPIPVSGTCGSPASPGGTPPSCASLVTPPPAQTSISPSNPYTVTAEAAAPNLKLPRVYQFNVALQQALGGRQSLTATYVGAVGRNLVGTAFEAPAPLLGMAGGGSKPVSPTFGGDLLVFGNYATSGYHALQGQFQRQFSGGLGGTASYTWSHSIDDASNFNTGITYPLSLSRSSSDFDVRHTFAGSLVYSIPTPLKDNGFARAILGHWSVAPIYHFQTAVPVNVTFRNSFIGGVPVSFRPNLIPGIPLYAYDAQCKAENQAFTGVYGCPGGRAFNNAALGSPGGATVAQATAAGCDMTPPSQGGGEAIAGPLCSIPFTASAGSQGNAGRNFLRGYHLQQLDLDFNRDFALEKGIHLRFEGDFFNIFNHPNFASPASFIQFPNFGLTGSMQNNSLGGGGGFNPLYQLGGPRSVQLALKVIF